MGSLDKFPGNAPNGRGGHSCECLSPFGGVTAYGFLDQGEGGCNAPAIYLVPAQQGEILDRRIIESLGLVVDRIPHQRFAGGGIAGIIAVLTD